MIRTVVEIIFWNIKYDQNGFKYVFRIDNRNVVVFYNWICCGNKAIRINGIIRIRYIVDAVLRLR
jgi:hypothetical protein